jgi:long-chain fatty acid transport protein
MNIKTLGKTIPLSLALATTLHATNGDTLIGIGAKSRGMGGVGIAVSHGAESILNNPALITTVENNKISFGGTVFMPDIQTQLNANPNALPPQAKMTSDADVSIIPEVSIAMKITDTFYIGMGMWGTAGMGTDFIKGNGISETLASGNFSNFDMVTNLQLMQFSVPLAYKHNALSVAIAPIVQYGNLDINYAMPDQNTPGSVNNIGAGLAQDFGFGFTVGATYDMSNGLVLGAVYKSAIDMEYRKQLTSATQPFGVNLPDGDHLEQPSQFGFGIAYTVDNHTIAADYRKVQWSEAKGYQDFGWDDQNIYAIGYEYTEDNWVLRAGYNYSSSSVVETNNPALNMFNLLGFPATAESHYTIGGGYQFNDQFSMDLAYVYAPNSKNTYDVSALQMGLDSLTNEHIENSISFQLNYQF